MLVPRFARLSTIVHATEDDRKVYKALVIACPSKSFSPQATAKRFKGHHGNEIQMITMDVPKSKCQAYLRFLWTNLSTLDRDQILSFLSNYVDGSHVLHLRLGKQDCLRGILRVTEEDPIKVEIGFHFLSQDGSGAIEILKQSLSGLDTQDTT